MTPSDPFHPYGKIWISGAFILFFIASIFGIMMRLWAVDVISNIPYKYILHAHSHTALLGYGFLFLSGLFLFLLRPKVGTGQFYKRAFTVYFIAILGMAASFLYQGYGPLSITFSTILLIITYAFIYRFLRNYKSIDTSRKNHLIPWSLYWYMLSTAGVWALGPVTAILEREHQLYFLCIQFFLHFQFNGWFTYAIIGTLLWFSQKKTPKIRLSTRGFWTLNLSLILTFFLSVTLVQPVPIYFLLTSIGVLLQLIAYYLILKPVLVSLNKELILKNWWDWILVLGILSILIKVVIQGLVSLPALAVISYTMRDFIMGFIHLITLGSVTLTGAGLLLKANILPRNFYSKIGWIGLSATFIATEFILFGHAVFQWINFDNPGIYQSMILFASLPFPLFIGFIIAGIWKQR